MQKLQKPFVMESIYMKSYKTITSQNVPYEAHVKNLFILQKSYVPFPKYSNC